MFKPTGERSAGEYNPQSGQSSVAEVKNLSTLPSVQSRLQKIESEMLAIIQKIQELRTQSQSPQVLGELRALTTIQIDLIQEETLLLAKERELTKKGDSTYLVKKTDVWSESFEPATRGAGTTKVEEFGIVKKGATLGKSGEDFNWKGTLGTDDRHA